VTDPSGITAESAVVIAEAVRAGRRRATDVLAACEARRQEAASRLNALVQPRPAAARAEAAAVDACPVGILAGIPLSVKECFPVRGLRTTLGIPARAQAIDAADAAIVEAVRAAGGVIIGKANVPQAMYLHETDNPVFGRTNHPWAADRGPGGSSGGDAALVAAGVVPLGVGTDLAGSLRQPAHACGIAAIMPRSEIVGEAGSIDTLPHLHAVRPRAGFLARSADDLAVALAAVCQGATETTSVVRRVGWWDTSGPIPASPAIRRGVAEAVARLRAAGIEAVPLDGSLADEAAWIHLGIISADGAADIWRLLAGSRPIPAVARLLRLAGLPRWVRPAAAAAARLLGRSVEARGLLATGPRSAEGLAELLAARAAIATRLAALTAGCDAIVCPVSAVPALRHGTAARLVLAAAPCLLANLLDLAAGAVPVTTVQPAEETGRPGSQDPVLREAANTDRGSSGLPIGVQVVAPPGGDEAAVLAVMRLLEAGAATGHRGNPITPAAS